MGENSARERDPESPGYGLPELASQQNATSQESRQPELMPARTAKRVYAWFIDFFVFFGLWALLGWLASAWFALTVYLPLGLAAYLVAVAIPLTVIRGQTVGQSALGLVVVDRKGRRPPAPLRAAAHVMLSLVLVPFEVIFFWLLLIWKMLTGYSDEAEAGAAALKAMPGRALHDRIAGTVVIDLRHRVAGSLR